MHDQRYVTPVYVAITIDIAPRFIVLQASDDDDEIEEVHAAIAVAILSASP